MSGLQHNLQFLLRGHLHGIQAAFRKRGRRGREKEGEDDGEGEMTVLNWTLSMWNKGIYQDLQHHLFSFSEMSFLWSTGIWCIRYKICWAEPFLQRVMGTVSAGQPANLTSPQLMQNLSFSLRVDRRTPAAYCELKPQVIYAVTCNQNDRKPTLGCTGWIPWSYLHLFFMDLLVQTQSREDICLVPPFPASLSDVALQYYRICYQILLSIYFMYYAKIKGSEHWPFRKILNLL